jgi:hypothetical protein
MSDLTFLVAQSFLVIAGIVSTAFIGKVANDTHAQIVTGVVRGTPVSTGVRRGMLFGMWLPWQAAIVALTAFLALTQLEIANHVSGANVKLVAYYAGFLAASGSVFVLLTSVVRLFRYSAKVRRDQES